MHLKAKRRVVMKTKLTQSLIKMLITSNELISYKLTLSGLLVLHTDTFWAVCFATAVQLGETRTYVDLNFAMGIITTIASECKK